MEINEAIFKLEGNNIQVSMPIVKVNKDTRTVSGFATLDNIDSQGDIVTADASEKAFSKWRGNVREQHSPNAVGKLLSFEPQEYYDADSGETYKGIYVNAYVSKGAQDTWEKVLDGTLTGFSIGGGIVKSQNVFAKAEGGQKRVRKVTDYTISELSLVDNPANQLANILSFQKNADGNIDATGLVMDTSIENIFYCLTDEIAITTNDDESICHKCEVPMENIGWIEIDDENEENLVKSAVEKFIKQKSFASEEKIDDNKYNITINVNGDLKKPKRLGKIVKEALKTKGGVKVAEEITKVEDTTEEPTTDVVEKSVDGVEEPAAEVSEVEEPNEFKKMLTDFTANITTVINESKESTVSALNSFKEEFSKSVTTVDEKVSKLAEEVTSLAEKVNSQDETITEVEKRVVDVEGETAIKKSGDLGGESEGLIKKSIWGGAFLPVAGLQQ